jgi:hypothetical protein
LITYHIGNAYQPLNIFSKLEQPMERIDFYFIHPYILSRQGLMALSAELDAPDILKREVGFLHTTTGNYRIDFVRKVFQLLSNIHEIVEFALQMPNQNVRIFFFVREIPSVCVQIVRNVGYLFLIPAAFDNAKFLSRFTLEISDKDITEEFVKFVDHSLIFKERVSTQSEGLGLSEAQRERLGGMIERFEISKENLDSLCTGAIRELAAFLKDSKISKTDVERIGPEVMLKLPGDVEFIKMLYNQLIELY